MKFTREQRRLGRLRRLQRPIPGWSHTFMRAPVPFFALRSFVPCSLMLFLCVTTIGCSDGDNSQDIQPLQCRLNSDCGAGQICVESACVEDSEACQGPDCPCASAADCGVGQDCDIDTGACFDLECLGDRDCPLGQVCISGRCDTDLEADRDRDGVPDNEDRCPDIEDADQQDSDGDLQGDACDTDDDNDAVPDTIDNCPLTPNPVQGDIDGDQQGNACDPDASHIDVRGALDFSQLPGADTSLARVFISGLDAPINIEPNGDFLIDEALAEPSRFNITVRWPGFDPIIQEFTAGDGEAVIDVGALEMTPQAQGEDAAEMRGQIVLEGLERHADIIVRARVGGSLTATTLTDEDGHFVLEAPPVDLTLEFAKNGFESRALELRYNTQGENEGRFTFNDTPIDDIEDLVLERLTGTASVTVTVEPDWLPQGQRAVTVTVIGNGEERSAVANNAPVSFTDLPAGNYIAFADRPGFSQGRQLFTIDQLQPTANVDLTISLGNLSDANIDLSGVTLSGDDLRQVANLANADLSGVTIAPNDPNTPAELCNLDLSGVSLANADLTGVNLAGSNLTGARLDNATLTGASLRAANLTNASLFSANLARIDLRNGPYDCQGQPNNGRRTLLTNANLNSANLTNANITPGGDPGNGDPCTVAPTFSPEMTGVRWIQTNLTGAVLHTADFNRANFSSTIMTGADLRRACMTGATILRADLTDASLQNADITDASIINTLGLRTDFTNAVLIAAQISGANLQNANLTGIEGQYLTMSSVILSGAVLNRSQFQQSSWVGALLNSISMDESTDFTDADLRNSEWTDVAFNGASFHSADLRNANLFQTHLSNVNFENASLAGANFNGANIENTNFIAANLSGTTFSLSRYNRDTLWPDSFEFRNLNAFGPETQLQNKRLPNDLNLINIDLSDADLSNTTIQGVNLTGATLTNTNLTNAVLSRGTLTNATLQRTNLTNANLNDTILINAALIDANLHNAQLMVAELTEATFTNGSLVQADLTNATLARASITRTLTSNTNFTNMDLTDTTFVEVPLVGNNFTNANLAGLDLEGFNIQNSTFTNANLTNANLQQTNLTGVSMVGTRLTNTNMQEANLTNANLQQANLTNANLQQANLTNTNLQQALLLNANLAGTIIQRTRILDLSVCPSHLPDGYQCIDQPDNNKIIVGPSVDITDAVLTGISLRGVNFAGARLLGTDLTNADLADTNFTNANLTDADLTHARLNRADLTIAILTNTNLTGADLTNADLTSAFFNDRTVCPNGQFQSEFPRCGFEDQDF